MSAVQHILAVVAILVLGTLFVLTSRPEPVAPALLDGRPSGAELTQRLAEAFPAPYPREDFLRVLASKGFAYMRPGVLRALRHDPDCVSRYEIRYRLTDETVGSYAVDAAFSCDVAEDQIAEAG